MNQYSSVLESKENSSKNNFDLSNIVKKENFLKEKKDNNSDKLLVNLCKDKNFESASDAEFVQDFVNKKNQGMKFEFINKNGNFSEASENDKNLRNKNKKNSYNSSSRNSENKIEYNISKKSLSPINISNNANNYLSNNCNLTKITDINCDSFTKLDNFIDENINKAEIPTDSPC